MNTKFERGQGSDEWYTPRWILDALGPFDLDPCAARDPLWPTARIMYDEDQDGLLQEWKGRVFLNPPYSRPLIWHFVEAMAQHNHGISLLYNRLDSAAFQRHVLRAAAGIYFIRGRIRFFRPDGKEGKSPGCGSILAAYGPADLKVLQRIEAKQSIPGVLFCKDLIGTVFGVK